MSDIQREMRRDPTMTDPRLSREYRQWRAAQFRTGQRIDQTRALRLSTLASAINVGLWLRAKRRSHELLYRDLGTKCEHCAGLVATGVI